MDQPFPCDVRGSWRVGVLGVYARMLAGSAVLASVTSKETIDGKGIPTSVTTTRRSVLQLIEGSMVWLDREG